MPPLWEAYLKVLINLIILTFHVLIPGNKTANQLNISMLFWWCTKPIVSAWPHSTKISASEKFPTLSCSSSVLSLFSQHLSPHSGNQPQTKNAGMHSSSYSMCLTFCAARCHVKDGSHIEELVVAVEKVPNRRVTALMWWWIKEILNY